MFYQTQTARRPLKNAVFLSLWPWPLIYDLDIQTCPSDGSETSSLWIWRKSVQRFPIYFIHKQKRHSSAQNRTLSSSLRAVISRKYALAVKRDRCTLSCRCDRLAEHRTSILVYLFFELQLFRVPQNATASTASLRPISYQKLANLGLLLKFNTAHRLTFFCPNFTSICPVTLQINATTLYPLQNVYFFRRHFATLSPKAPKF